MNKAILLGRLTKDPEFQTTTTGVAVCNFTLAVPRKYSNANGEKEVDFINIVTWRNTAENCHKYLSKGNQVSVIGSIQVRSYEAQDGTKRYVTEVVAEEVEFLNTKNNQEDIVSAPIIEEKPKASLLEDIEDTLPF